MERRRSPPEVAISACTVSGDTVMCSSRAMCSSRDCVELLSSGLNLNLLQRDASGSIILRRTRQVTSYAIESSVPRNVVADKTETRYARVVFHDAAQGGLRVLGHRVCLVEDNNLERWTWVGGAVGRYDCRCRCLAREGLNFLADDGDAALVGGVELEDARAEVVWAGARASVIGCTV